MQRQYQRQRPRQRQRQSQHQSQVQYQGQSQVQHQRQHQLQNYITNVIRRGETDSEYNLRNQASAYISSHEKPDSDSVLTLKLPKIINILQKIQEIQGENVTGPIDALKKLYTG